MQVIGRKEGVSVHGQVAHPVLAPFLNAVGEDEVLGGDVVGIKILGPPLLPLGRIRLGFLVAGAPGQVHRSVDLHIDIPLVEVIIFQAGFVLLSRILLVAVGFAEKLPPGLRLEFDDLLQFFRGNRLVSDETDFGDESPDPLVDLKGDLRFSPLHLAGDRRDLGILEAFIPVKILHGHRVTTQALLRKDVPGFGDGFLLFKGVGQGLGPALLVGGQRLEFEIQQVFLVDRQLVIQAPIRPLSLHFNLGNADLGGNHHAETVAGFPAFGGFIGSDDLHVAVIPRRVNILDVLVHRLLGVPFPLGTLHVLPDFLLIDGHIHQGRGILNLKDFSLARGGRALGGRGRRNKGFSPGLALSRG